MTVHLYYPFQIQNKRGEVVILAGIKTCWGPGEKMKKSCNVKVTLPAPGRFVLFRVFRGSLCSLKNGPRNTRTRNVLFDLGQKRIILRRGAPRRKAMLRWEEYSSCPLLHIPGLPG